MSTPANIRVNIGAPFPATVKGGGPVSVAKQNGIWTVSISIANLGLLPPGTDPTRVQLLVWNAVNNVFQQTTIAAIQSTNPPATIITSANSPYTPNPSDTFLLVDTTGGAVEIDLTLAVLRNNVSISIKDYKGNAANHNITIKPSGSETIDNFTNAAPLVLNANYDSVVLYPQTGFYVLAP